MAKIDKIRVFLASPGDVTKERTYVARVIAEVNRDIALKYDMVLELISSERASPGFGKDGQAILNEKIAKNMKSYELFIGIMWSRIGTPTPRAISGTVEEFRRAERAFNKYGKPDIWFYFRNAPIPGTTQEELDQKGKVLKLKEELRRKSLLREYRTLTEFREKLREHLIDFLISHRQQGTTSRISAPISNRRRPAGKDKTDKTEKTPATPTPKRASVRKVSTGVVKGPGDWVMLNDEFYPSKSINVQSSRTTVLRLSPISTTQATQLRSLQPDNFARTRNVSCAYEHEAAIMQVQSVDSETTPGKTTVTITLSQLQRSNNNTFGMDVTYQNFSPQEIAQLRARLLLLGEPLPPELARFFPSFQIGESYSSTVEIKRSFFSDLWLKLRTPPTSFLPKAWLSAVFVLKMSNIVEEILLLELGPISKKVMPVRFRGRRRRIYTNQEPAIIEFTGNCTLEV